MNSLKRNVFAISLLSLIFGAAPLCAQASPPVLKPPGKNAHWVLEFTPPKAKPATTGAEANTEKPPRLPVRMDVSNSDGIRLFKTKFNDGVEETAYVLDKMRLIRRSNDAEISVLDPLERSSVEYDAPLNVYPGFGWISQSNFRGEATIGDRVCNKYTRELPPLASASGKPDQDLARATQGWMTEAYVDKATLQPLAYVDGGMMVSYRFEADSAPFTLPDEYRKAIRRQAGYRTE